MEISWKCPRKSLGKSTKRQEQRDGRVHVKINLYFLFYFIFIFAHFTFSAGRIVTQPLSRISRREPLFRERLDNERLESANATVMFSIP